MSMTGDMVIENHNALMESDEDYARRYHDFMEDRALEQYFERNERELDWFEDFKLAHDGYTEFDEPILNVELIGNINLIDDDLPF